MTMNYVMTSLIAATVTIIVTMWKENVDAKQRHIAYLHSILAEVNALLAMISVREKEFEQQDINDIKNYEFVYFPVSYNYFNVYEGTASQIGLIKNAELRERIICSYADTKGLLENVKDIEKLSKMYELVTLLKNNSVDKYRLVKIHYWYCKHTLENQVPMVKRVLVELRKELEKEIHKRSNTFHLYIWDSN